MMLLILESVETTGYDATKAPEATTSEETIPKVATSGGSGETTTVKEPVKTHRELEKHQTQHSKNSWNRHGYVRKNQCSKINKAIRRHHNYSSKSRQYSRALFICTRN
ncbi:unnamed protein product [Caenorhabditis brenneri]